MPALKKQKEQLPRKPFLGDPIGLIHTGKMYKFELPHQATESRAPHGIVELFPGRNFEAALSDIEGFSHIWLIWWFHRNTTWKPKVLPPRGERQKRGVFATRSPHRPNQIGITAVPLLRVEGLKLYVGPCDLLDGTPILDIKPYLPSVDSIPDSRAGWIEELEKELTQSEPYEVQLSARATEQIEWLQTEWGIEFYSAARGILSVNPNPHRSRRIVKIPDGSYRISCGAWRLFFERDGRRVKIISVACGYPQGKVREGGDIPHREALLAFHEKWGDASDL